jgi:hypothetical protein
VVAGEPGKGRVVASWHIMPAAQKTIEASFSKPRCAAPAAAFTELLAPLRDAIGDVGKDFADGGKRLGNTREGGWPAMLVVVARSWPNLLPELMKRAALHDALADAPGGEVCLRHRDGRFEIEGPLVVPDKLR